jgi:site-specific DNA-methyltransferase (adenine-specific)
MADQDPTTRRTPDEDLEKDEQRTPPALFVGLDFEFKFTLDPCSTKVNHLAPKFYTKADDGLSKSWAGERVFMNPPYRRKQLAAWVEKAAREACSGDVLDRATVVGLLPATRTEQPWWHDFVIKPKAEIRYLRGRLKFLTSKGVERNAASFPSVLVIWR